MSNDTIPSEKKSVFIPFKAPGKLILKLDEVAKSHYEGNRSLAIREAIRLLIDSRGQGNPPK